MRSIRVVIAGALFVLFAHSSRSAAQSTMPDSNGDGVPDSVDLVCPCDSSAWKNHGKYVSCVAQVVEAMGLDPIIEGDIMRSAAHSYCGSSPNLQCSDCHKRPDWKDHQWDCKEPPCHWKCSDCHKK
jgi:hypothetical protein